MQQVGLMSMSDLYVLITAKGWLKNYLAFCLQNVQSLWDFCGQIMPSYFCTIPKFSWI